VDENTCLLIGSEAPTQTSNDLPRALTEFGQQADVSPSRRPVLKVAINQSAIASCTPKQTQDAPVMTSEPKATTVFDARMPIGQPPIAFGPEDLFLCRRPGPSSYVED